MFVGFAGFGVGCMVGAGGSGVFIDADSLELHSFSFLLDLVLLLVVWISAIIMVVCWSITLNCDRNFSIISSASLQNETTQTGPPGLCHRSVSGLFWGG